MTRWNPLDKILTFFRNEKGVFYLSLGTIISNVAGAILWILLANILVVADYGRVEYLVAVASVLSALGLMSMNTLVLTFVPRNNQRIGKQSNLIVLFNGIIIASAFYLYSYNISVTVFLIAQMFFTMATSEILARRNHKEYAVVIINYKILQISLSLLLYYLIGVNGIILGYGISALIFSYRFFFYLKSFKFEFDELKTRKKFIFFSYALALAGTMNTLADKLVIAPFFGYESLGFYQLGFQFLVFLGMIPNILFQYLLPNESAGENKTTLKKVGIAALLITTVSIFLLTPAILEYIFPKYTSAVDTVRIMVIAAIPTGFTSIILARFLAEERTFPILISSIIFAGVQIPLLIVFGKEYGTLGLALATLLGHSIQTLTLLIFRNFLREKPIFPKG